VLAVPPPKWLVISAVTACIGSVLVLLATAPPGPEDASARDAALTRSPTFEPREEKPLIWRIDAQNWPSHEYNWPTPAYRIADLYLVVEETDPATRKLYSSKIDFSFQLDFLDSQEACVALDTNGPLTAAGPLSDLWKGFGDEHAERRLASLASSAIPFTIVFTTIGRDPVLRHTKAHLMLVPPHDASMRILEDIVFPLRFIAAIAAIVSSTWLGWVAAKAS
jgi:hypothetical protein